MNKGHLVSVIMPCFNSEHFLATAIESVINQTYTNWELIIVDDCSTDSSNQIIQSFSEKDIRVKYFCTNSPSGSPTLPRNIAINKSKGCYLAFLDSDDIWLPNKLYNQIKHLEENSTKNIAISYTNYERISESGIRQNRQLTFRLEHTYESLLLGNDIVCSSAVINLKVLKDKRYFKKIGHEDYEYWLRILSEGFVASNCNSVEVLYRMRKESISSGRVKAFRWLWHIHKNELHHGILKSLYYINRHVLGHIKKNLKVFINR